ncbi:MAG: hypothetical protein RJQ00_06540 [Vicingaceae bacterium]
MTSKLLNLLTEYKSEYQLKYRKAKIYHGGQDYDLSKRWYVYYSFRHPSTGKMKQQAPVYLNANRDYKTKEDRLRFLRQVKDQLNELLDSGFSPYEDNFVQSKLNGVDALAYALDLKKKTLKGGAEGRTFKDYESRIKSFEKYLGRTGLINLGEIYAIVTNEFRTIKIVTESDNKENLTLIPYNKSQEFVNQEIPKSLIQQMYAVKGSIKKFF